MLIKFNAEGRTLSEMTENALTVAREVFTDETQGMQAHCVAVTDVRVETFRPTNITAQCVAGTEQEVREHIHYTRSGEML